MYSFAVFREHRCDSVITALESQLQELEEGHRKAISANDEFDCTRRVHLLSFLSSDNVPVDMDVD